MRTLTTDELAALGDRFGVDVDEAELDTLREMVNENLATLDAVDDVPLDGHDDGGKARTWERATDDPYNAIATRCHVPPTADAGDSLAGATVGLKDTIAVAGVPMECASAVMRGYVPGRDATVVSRLREAGATITAKTNLDEFASSARGTTGADGPVRNPVDPERTAGGSSGGSAVAVATDEVDVTLGTDTGGSTRIPASFCGVVGVKPTWGLVPGRGVVENTYTQDHVGPMTSTVADAARVLEAVAGPDEGDPASLQAAGREQYRVGGYVDAAVDPPALADLTLGVLDEGFGEGVTDRVVTSVEGAVATLEDTGATTERVSVDYFHAGPAIKNLLSFTELAAHWRAGGAPYRRGGGVDEGYQAALAARSAAKSGELGQFYKSKLLAGARIIEAHDGVPYTRAQAAREVYREAFEAALADVDALVTPTMPDVAPRIADAADPGFDYIRNTLAADVTRLPAISLPGLSADGLPVGVQLMGEAFADADLFGVAAAVAPHLD
ncbi:MAG: amidase [Haloferacaceae archaeon]